MIAVVPGDAALVELEADATVGGDPGAEVRDADGDVIDALENGCATPPGSSILFHSRSAGDPALRGITLSGAGQGRS
jgi:hypothetical protein